MMTLSRILHLFALALWFGMGVFFSFVVAFSLFGSFEKLAVEKETDSERPLWFRISPYYEKDLPARSFRSRCARSRNAGGGVRHRPHVRLVLHHPGGLFPDRGVDGSRLDDERAFTRSASPARGRPRCRYLSRSALAGGWNAR